MRRAAELAWIAVHEDDIASDLSAIHHIRRPGRLPAPRFFALAERLMAYPGVIQALWRVGGVHGQQAMVDAANAEQPDRAAGRPAHPSSPNEVPATAGAVSNHVGFSGDVQTGYPPVFEIGHA